MIVDVHTHLSTLEQWGPTIRDAVARTYGGAVDLHVTPERHRSETRRANKVVVFGINALALDMHTPNDVIAEYVTADPERIVGFMSVDPHQPDALDEVDRCASDLGLKGIKMSPVYQDYDPTELRAGNIHAKAQELGLPIIVHAAFQGMSKAPMEWANPLSYDPVARDFPDLKLVLAHMGIPWHAEAMIMVRKHPNVYADVSICHLRPWWMYQALMAFHESDVMHKLLFGSDFPFGKLDATIDGMRNVNSIVEGTGMPRIPDEEIEGIINRDSLTLLGID